MSARATTVAQGFSNKLLKEMYERSLTDTIVNRDYQGEINGVGSKLNILNIGRITEQTYSGANLTVADLTEFNAVLTIDQYKSFYWKEKDLDNWLSYIKDPHATVVAQKADERAKNMDSFVLGLYADAGAGVIGTAYTTGDVTINNAGTVTGNGTTFTAGMVGLPFKATGHSKWYRVATYSGATSITIENNSDDLASSYDGGAIGGGSAYTIQGVSAVSITTSNLLQKIADLKQMLDEQEKYGNNAVPDTDRFLIVPPEFYNTVVRASGVVLHVPEVYTNLIQKGYIGDLLGFRLFQSSRLTGNNTTGYHMIGGSPLWCTFAEKLIDADIEEDLIGNFGSAYKDLFVYGAKVADARRHMAGQIFATFA
jgi:hypothetical protein